MVFFSESGFRDSTGEVEVHGEVHVGAQDQLRGGGGVGCLFGQIHGQLYGR